MDSKISPLAPYFLDEIFEDTRRQQFGNTPVFDLTHSMILNWCMDEISKPKGVVRIPLSSTGWLPKKNIDDVDSGLSIVHSSNSEFIVHLDVQQFKPEELKVKLVDDFLVVEGKHEERPDQHGLISRQFTRRCKIPEDVDKTALISNLSSDGILTLKAPKLTSLEREIPIIRTNAPAVKTQKPE